MGNPHQGRFRPGESVERKHRLRRFASLTLLLAGTIPLLAAGCNRSRSETVHKVQPVAKKAPPAIDYAKIRPNEVGQIPILMYHDVGGKPYPRDPGLVRSVDAFKKDLELLYAANFRPVNLSDVLNNSIHLPPGKSPVVFTFDDARASQFRLIEGAAERRIDPDCALGILQAFHQKHSDWDLRATFFVLPRSEKTQEPFGQPGADDKFRYLVEQGMELANHSIHHRSFRHMTPDRIQAEIGGANNLILQAAPKARITSVALPMGVYPPKRYWPYLIKGTYEGKAYAYKAALLAAWRPIPAPASKKYNPLRLERISPVEGVNGLRWWLKKLENSDDRYVSDGDPNVISVPKSLEKEVNTARLKAQSKILYAYGGGQGGSKPIVGADAEEKVGTKTPAPSSRKPITGG